MEYVYKLNLPSIEDILLPGKYNEMFVETSAKHTMVSPHPFSFLKPEYITVNNYTFDGSFLIYKTDGQSGWIHDDGKTAWAVNYIVNGIAEMRYYDRSRLSKPKLVKDTVGILRPVYRDDITIESDRRYMMPDGIYLVRTDQPHLAMGHQKRYCLSLRAIDEQKVLPWETVVESFKPYIIND